LFRNYFAAAWRNLARNKLYAAINIVGLAVGFAAAILIALFVRDELSYDRFWPDFQRVYIVNSTINLPGRAPWIFDAVPADVPARWKAMLPADVLMARLQARPHALRHGDVEANERIVWADPNLFSVLSLPTIAGDPATALQRPDGIVLTESIARKYFGEANAVGQTLELDRTHPMYVAAVVKDLPTNTHFNGDVFASGRAVFSALTELDSMSVAEHGISADTTLYVKLPAGFPAEEAARRLRSLADSYLRAYPTASGVTIAMALLPVADIHLGSRPGSFGDKPRGDPAFLYAVSLVGLLIVAVAAINFITLMTARAGRRSVEIGVRKASGAQPGDLIVQFIGESVIHCLAGMIIALALVELVQPWISGYLQRALSLNHASDVTFYALVAVLALATGIGAGIYPALVLARMRPVTVLKSGPAHTAGSGSVRQALVVSQFAVLIGLILATAVVYRQVHYALNEALRLDKDQMLTIRTGCTGAFVIEVRKLPGVRGAACSASAPFEFAIGMSGAFASNGHETTVRDSPLEPGLLELYGLKPLAGRFFSPDQAADSLPLGSGLRPPGPVVLNETAVRKLGFASPAAAVGQTIRWRPQNQPKQAPSQIIGVVADFPVGSVREPVDATAFYVQPMFFKLLSVKLTGRQLPETMEAIEKLWKQVGEPRPIRRFFVDQYFQDQYADDMRHGAMLAAFAGVALFVACLGLFGLSAFTAERRTKEIGVRKAMGASRGDIVRMLLWQFTRPVLWANLIAWPACYYFMHRWLQGFAYRTDLAPWMFLGAGGLAVAIASLTVSAHALLVARAKPVAALRYE
jgi:putative ABC transport system permease protein